MSPFDLRRGAPGSPALGSRAWLVVALALLGVGSGVRAEEPAAPESSVDPLWLWKDVMERFKEAGRLAAQKQFDETFAVLDRCARDYPAEPYGRWAERARGRLEWHISKRGIFDVNKRLASVCEMLFAREDAAALYTRALERGEDNRWGLLHQIAWCLAESGETEAAVKMYRARMGGPDAEQMRERYTKAIHLITERHKRPDDIEFIKGFVEARYGSTRRYSGPDRKDLPALAELTRILPLATDEEQRVEIYFLIIARLAALRDEQGTRAWEDRLLGEFPHNTDACAQVYVQRGQRAYKKKDLDEALAAYRAASTRYPDSDSHGIAQYNVGIVLKEQGKPAEAIAAFEKIFPSHVDDRDRGAHVMQTNRNYRHNAGLRISECYEAMGDYGKALDYACLARDKYPFVSWCATCLASAETDLNERISRLWWLRILHFVWPKKPSAGS